MIRRLFIIGMILAAGGLGLVTGIGAVAGPPAVDADTMKGPSGTSLVVLLGTGTPIADPARSGPCVAIVVNDAAYLVDCGPGVVRRAMAAHLSGVGPLHVSNLKRLFATHLHSDHTAGYPDLILTPWVLDRNAPLEVYGPKGTQEMTDHILAAYHEDIHLRLHGLEEADAEGHMVNVHEIEPGLIYEDSNVRVEAFPVKHGSWPVAFGFKFYTPDRTIVISGDTVPCESLIEHAKGCDVLVHEVYSVEGFKQRSPHWQEYHSSFHTSSYELAEIAAKVKPHLLVLYHQLLWGTSEDQLRSEIQERYDGKVVSGRDLDVF